MSEESWERQWLREAVAAPLTLTDFLLARIAEDEVDAATRHRLNCASIPSVIRYLGLCDCGIPDRVLAECEAKRRIVEAATDYSPELEHGDNGEWAFDVALRMLALPYVDHPDYRGEWRP